MKLSTKTMKKTNDYSKTKKWIKMKNGLVENYRFTMYQVLKKSPPAFCERTARETKFFKCDDFILEWYTASEYHIIWNNVLTVYVYHQMNRNNCCVAPGEIVPIIRAHKINWIKQSAGSKRARFNLLAISVINALPKLSQVSMNTRMKQYF